MFSPATTQRNTQRITRELSPASSVEPRRSLRQLVRDAVDTAIEFATLGEANLPRPQQRSAAPVPHREHPRQAHLDRRPRARRAGTPAPRAHVCTTPSRTPSARSH